MPKLQVGMRVRIDGTVSRSRQPKDFSPYEGTIRRLAQRNEFYPVQVLVQFDECTIGHNGHLRKEILTNPESNGCDCWWFQPEEVLPLSKDQPEEKEEKMRIGTKVWVKGQVDGRRFDGHLGKVIGKDNRLLAIKFNQFIDGHEASWAPGTPQEKESRYGYCWVVPDRIVHKL